MTWRMRSAVLSRARTSSANCASNSRTSWRAIAACDTATRSMYAWLNGMPVCSR
jgi:hypothetical protein